MNPCCYFSSLIAHNVLDQDAKLLADAKKEGNSSSTAPGAGLFEGVRQSFEKKPHQRGILASLGRRRAERVITERNAQGDVDVVLNNAGHGNQLRTGPL